MPEIRKLATEKFEYKKCAELSYALQLQGHFEMNEFIIPCILENRTDFLENFYLASYPGLAEKFVAFLDDLYEDNVRKISDLYQAHPNQKALDCKRLNQKPLGKFIEKMLDKFNVDGAVFAKNHIRIRKYGAFKYHLGTKDEAKMSK